MILDGRLRKRIEFHFFNYNADKLIESDTVRDIAESGLTADFNRIGSRAGRTPNLTEKKGLLLYEQSKRYLWPKVVENTFTAFRFEPEYEIMHKRYVERVAYKELFAKGLPERTYWYWRDRWLDYAYMWAKEYKLL